MTIEIIHGDCREVLKELDDNSVDAVVTDPPYGLEFMGKDWDAPWKKTSGGFSSPGIGDRQTDWPSFKGSNRFRCANCGLLVGQGGSPCRCKHPKPVSADAARMQVFQAWCTEWAADLLRVLKPGGHLLAFGGSRTYHRLASAVEDAGFEIRDQIMWIYGSGFPKSSNQTDDWEGWGTALKPAHEPIVVARKPLIGTVPANLAKYGVGALNIDGCRVEADDGANRARPPRTANTILGGGKGTNLTASHHNDIGRWPANVIHDGSDEVLAAFPASSVTGKRSDRSREAVVKGTAWLSSNHKSTEYTDGGSTARFFYCAKTSKQDRDDGLTTEEQPAVTFATANGTSGKPSSISEGRNTAYKNTHPTVKPTSLMQYLVRLVTPPGGVVLDPFMGSGSTGRGAVLEGFNFIGVELDEQYVAIARARIAAVQPSIGSVFD